MPRKKLPIVFGVVMLVVSLTFVLVFLAGRTLGGEVLPGTQPLDWTDDLSVRIVDEAHRFLDRKLDESIAARERFWNRDFSSQEAYEKSIEPNREQFRK